MSASQITISKIVYLDGGTIRTLIDSGEYRNARETALAQGKEFATDDTIIAEMRRIPVGMRSDALNQFLRNPGGEIKLLPPHPSITPDTRDRGEESLVRRIIDERAAGNSTSEIYTQDTRAIARYRNPTDGRPTSDIPFRRFGDGDVQNRPTPGILNDLYGNDPAGYARTRDAISGQRNVPNNSANPDSPAFNPNKQDHQRFPSDAQLGIERQTEYNPRTNQPDVTRVPAGTPTDGANRVSANEARPAPGSNLDRATKKLTDGPRAELERVRSNPASYTPEGDYTPTAQRSIDTAAKAAGAAGLALLGYDFATTLDLVQRLNEQGKFAEAQREVAKFAGRNLLGALGGSIGTAASAAAAAALGRAVGGAAGSILGPIGTLLGGLLGGYIGAELGDDLGNAASDRLPTLFGDSLVRRDPLVLDLNFDGVRLTSLTGTNIRFDLDGDGFAERTGWVSAQDGLLVLDQNGNGTIDNGNELFGTSQQDGFTVLRGLDSNADGIISSADARYGELRVWRDRNQDGFSQPDELLTLAGLGIASINLNATPSTQTRADNGVIFTGTYTLTSGPAQEIIAVNFSTDQVNTSFERPIGFQIDAEAYGLPNLRGFGTVPDLAVAITLDPVLKQMVKDFIQENFQSIDQTVGRSYSITGLVAGGGPIPITYHYEASKFEDILARWAGVPINSGDKDETQIQRTAEAFLNRPLLVGLGAGNPNFYELFKKFAADQAVRFFTQVAVQDQNRAAFKLITDLTIADRSGGGTISDATLDTLAAGLNATIDQPSTISPAIADFALISYDFGRDTITGDISGLIDRQLQSLNFDPANPFAGRTEWLASHRLLLDTIDRDRSIVVERLRAHSGNQDLTVFTVPHVELAGTTGDDIVSSASTAGVLPVLFRGLAGNDRLQGDARFDTYVFGDGSGADTVVDSGGRSIGGTEDEIAFQDSLVSTLATYSFASADRRDLRISFAGRSESVTVEGYFTPDGLATIEKITFPDGPRVSERTIRDAVMVGLATAGNDNITAFSAGSALFGNSGDDLLYGLFGDDELFGGIGNDTLYGRGGNDTYRFDRGDGQDIIQDFTDFFSGKGGIDTLALGAGIRPSEISVAQSNFGNDLIISIQGTTDRVTLVGTINDPLNRIEQLQFSDGSVLTASDLLALSTTATTGNDVFFGGYDDDILSGGAGDDVLTGRDGGDTLSGGTGNDTLNGSGGNDVYRFGRGDGQDVVKDFTDFFTGVGGNDTVEFGIGITATDVAVIQGVGGGDFILSIIGTTDRITLVGSIYEPKDRIEQVRFANGAVLTHNRLFELSVTPTSGDDQFFGDDQDNIISGGAGNDTLTGRFGNDILAGGTGNDYLTGSGGDDIYRFGRGDGQDVVKDFTDFFTGTGGIDTVEFGVGIVQSDVIVTQGAGGGDIILSIIGTTDRVTLVGSIFEPKDRIEQVRFADGSILTHDQLFTLSALGSAGDDLIFGDDQNNILSGGAGNDRLTGRFGNDVLSGGTGNDYLTGSGGDDIYRFGRGDGQDIVTDFTDFFTGRGGNDTVELGAGITTNDITVSQADDGFSLKISINGTPDSLTLYDTNLNVNNRIEQVRLFDGMTLTHADLFARATVATAGDDRFFGGLEDETLSGGAGNDLLDGRFGNDILIGGIGNDTLSGSGGDDIYRIARGDGRDIISDFASFFTGRGGTDTVEFAADIRPEEIILTKANSGQDYIINFDNSDQRITLTFAATGDANYWIEQLRFGDGTVWDRTTFEARVIAANDDANAISGTASADNLRGLGGNDFINGLDGDDTLKGDLGNDTLYGSSGADIIFGGGGDDQIFGDGYQATGSNLLVNGGFETAGANATPQSFGITATTIPGWIKTNASVYELVDSGHGGVVATEGTHWLDLDGQFGDPNMNISQSVMGLADGQILSLNFDAANRTSAASGGFEVIWNGTVIATITEPTLVMRNYRLFVTAQAGTNTLGFRGIGNPDGLGASLDNVSLFATTEIVGGDDRLNGGSGNDVLTGGSGNDIFEVNGTADGYDTVNGGIGTDTIQAIGANTTIGLTSFTGVETISANGLAGVTIGGTALGDTFDFTSITLTGITRIDGNLGNDIITGSVAADVIAGGDGTDTLTGGTGNDSLSGDLGDDILIGGVGDDILSGGDGLDTFRFSGTTNGFDAIDGGLGSDTISVLANGTIVGATAISGIETINAGTFTGISIAGSTGADTINLSTVTTITGSITKIDGGAGDDNITGSSLNDTILGSGGNDTLSGSVGNDVFQFTGTASGFDAVDGGAGTDTISALANATVIGLSSLTGVEAISAGIFTGVYIAGSANNDTLNFSGATLTNIVRVEGGAGNDILTGNAAINTLWGGIGNDRIDGGAGNDSLRGDDGDDTLIGGVGNDVINGGVGIDTVDYSAATANLTINLATTAAQTVATGESDTISNVENVIGGSGADTLTGSTLANNLNGGAGNDRIRGGLGNDAITGGLGTDVAVFAGLQASYSIVTNAGTITVVDNQATTDGNDGTDTLIGVERAEFKGGVQVALAAPIVLDLNGDGVTLVDQSKSKAKFDWDGDGKRDKTGWIGKGDGLLVYDRNGDGTISGANELSFIDDKEGAKSDLDGLSAFDSNGDGLFSEADEKWASFRIWKDDGNGKVGKRELISLADAGVASITLAGQAVNRTYGWNENITVNTGAFTRTNGTNGALGDVALRYAPTSKTVTQNQPIQAFASQLAEAIAGFGIEDGGLSFETDALGQNGRVGQIAMSRMFHPMR